VPDIPVWRADMHGGNGIQVEYEVMRDASESGNHVQNSPASSSAGNRVASTIERSGFRLDADVEIEFAAKIPIHPVGQEFDGFEEPGPLRLAQRP
jgi:hypothetical protein